MIMTIHLKKRLRLIQPNNVDGKVLKTCIRCRQHKTKCDAFTTNPLPCTHCFKKNLNCKLDIIPKHANRGGDLVEVLTDEIKSLKETLDRIIERKQQTIKLLSQRAKDIQQVIPRTPPLSEIQSCLKTSTAHSIELPLTELDSISTDIFTISADVNTQRVSISLKDAADFFKNYKTNFDKYLPIFPNDYFDNLDIINMYQENELLFWSIILTSHLNGSQKQQYMRLATHVKSLVVKKCWYMTPRSIYCISALLILTTWPLPSEDSENISENVSVKYLTLMKNLAFQLGLHKVEFMHEFSHKTETKVSNELKLNNLLRERHYKFVNINSNYWLIYYGLSNNNINGLQNDYIINKANKELRDPSSQEDHYINSILKISMIQSRLNENLNDLMNSKSIASKLINLRMFEVILNDQHRLLKPNNLIKLSIEFSKLQLYVYSFSNLDVTIFEYKTIVKNALNSCYIVLNLFKTEFGDQVKYNQVPFHYKSVLELASFIMLRVFKSPLLDRVEEYLLLKEKFNECINILGGQDAEKVWQGLNSKLIKILRSFDSISNSELIKFSNGSFFLINRMKNQLVSSLLYELILFIYSHQKLNTTNIGFNEFKDFNEGWWMEYGLRDDNDMHRRVISYFKKNNSIFNL